jgi:hypothetical protein
MKGGTTLAAAGTAAPAGKGVGLIGTNNLEIHRPGRFLISAYCGTRVVAHSENGHCLENTPLPHLSGLLQRVRTNRAMLPEDERAV